MDDHTPSREAHPRGLIYRLNFAPALLRKGVISERVFCDFDAADGHCGSPRSQSRD